MQILNALEFSVAHVLPFDFCETYMSIGIVFEGDEFSKDNQRNGDSPVTDPIMEKCK